MTARPWLRHPPRIIPAPACPTGQPRYASHHHAALALLPGRTTLPITPTQCPLPECRGGWHNLPEQHMTETRKPFRNVGPKLLAFCEERQVCPTDCDDDCEDACHESHAIPARRDHQPDECPSAGRSTNRSQP